LPSPSIPNARWANGARSPEQPRVPCCGMKETQKAKREN
jgi:hypothetical protein